MKKILQALFCFLILSLSACSAASNQESLFIATPEIHIQIDSKSNKPVIALVPKVTANPIFAALEQGARQAETDFDIKLVVRTPAQDTSVDQQIQIVEDLILEEVDAIVITPIDSKELIPVLKKAQEAGIVVVVAVTRLDASWMAELGMDPVPTITTDDELAAYLSAGYLVKDISQPAKAAIIEGNIGAANTSARTIGAKRAFSENPNITLVSTIPANWRIDDAYTAMQTVLRAYPSVSLVFVESDFMALGVLEYLKDVHRTDVKLTGINGIPQALEALDAKNFLATVDTKSFEQGYLAVEYAVKKLRGEDVPLETLMDLDLVTAADVGEKP